MTQQLTQRFLIELSVSFHHIQMKKEKQAGPRTTPPSFLNKDKFGELWTQT